MCQAESRLKVVSGSWLHGGGVDEIATYDILAREVIVPAAHVVSA
jgi:hypothetical protein